jgi:hypothetical protein
MREHNVQPAVWLGLLAALGAHALIGCPPSTTLWAGIPSNGVRSIPSELFDVNKTTNDIDLLRPKPELDRHDPSNINR